MSRTSSGCVGDARSRPPPAAPRPRDSPSRRRSPPPRRRRAMPMSKPCRRRRSSSPARRRHRPSPAATIDGCGLDGCRSAVCSDMKRAWIAVAARGNASGRGPTCRSRPRAASRRLPAHRAVRECRRTTAPRPGPRRARWKGLLVALGQLDVLLGGCRPAASAAIASTRLSPMTRRLTSGGGTASHVLPNASASAAIDRRRRCRPACRRNRKSPAGSFAGLGFADRADDILPARAPVWPSIVAARSSAGLCWLNLRVPRMSVGSTSKPTIALVIASNLPGSILARVHGRSGECAARSRSLRRSSRSTSSSSRQRPRFALDLDRFVMPGRHLVLRHVPIGALIGFAARDADQHSAARRA